MSPVERQLAAQRFASDAEVEALLTRQSSEAQRVADRMVRDFGPRRAAQVAHDTAAGCNAAFPSTRALYIEVERIIERQFVQADLEASGIRPRAVA